MVSIRKKRRRSTTRRTVRGLRWANRLKARPSTIPEGKPKGRQRQGLIYEERVATLMAALYGEDKVIHGQWFEFEDTRGAGWCQTDVILLPEGERPLTIIECKLTATKGAGPKLMKVYAPVAKKAFGVKEVCLIQVCKNLKRSFEGVLIDKLDEAWTDKSDTPFVTFNLRNVPRL